MVSKVASSLVHLWNQSLQSSDSSIAVGCSNESDYGGESTTSEEEELVFIPWGN